MDGRDANPLDSFSKVDNLWFDDADVVFCAGRSKFRVYRGILSAQSPEFRTMLASANDTPGEIDLPSRTQNNTFSVIDLPDDENDVRYFFLSIFDPSFYMPLPSKYELEITVSILRLSTKYKVTFLIHRAILHLDSRLPLDSRTSLLYLVPPGGNYNASQIRHLLEIYFDVLLLATTSKALWLIPSVLYLINLRYRLAYIITHPSFGQLPSDMQAMIVRSGVNGELEDSHSNSWVGMLPSANCEDEEECALVSRSVQTLCQNSKTPLHWDVKMNLQNGKTFCRGCKSAGRKHKQDFEMMHWNQYATVSGFKSWDEARELRSRTLTKFG